MCTNCGCSTDSTVTITDMQTGMHSHIGANGHQRSNEMDTGHSHSHTHSHPHDHGAGELIRIEQNILEKNGRLAERNRGWLEGRGAIALNMMSSPGAGKTTLLERTIRDLGNDVEILVIEGDQATVRDAKRISATGAKVIQINTGAICHLDAEMVGNALRQLDPAAGAIVIIENVGNLVCPSLFDLGEGAKIVVASTTEGDDKPEKYPHMFRIADLIVLNKIDLLPYVTFDVAAFERTAARINPGAQLIKVSATTGTGMADWYTWIRECVKDLRCTST